MYYLAYVGQLHLTIVKKNFKTLDVDWYTLANRERVRKAIKQYEAGECYSNEEVFKEVRQMLARKKEEQKQSSR